MPTWLLDANVLLRVLTMDVPEQGHAARRLLARAADGEATLRMTALAFAEVVWVLERVYRWPPGEIASGLGAALDLPGLVMDDAAELREALGLFAEHRVSFIDAYQAAVAAQDGLEAVVSYDGGFDRLPGVQRMEP
jgi:predicted nucleic acid-binding protein